MRLAPTGFGAQLRLSRQQLTPPRLAVHPGAALRLKRRRLCLVPRRRVCQRGRLVCELGLLPLEPRLQRCRFSLSPERSLFSLLHIPQLGDSRQALLRGHRGLCLHADGPALQGRRLGGRPALQPLRL